MQAWIVFRHGYNAANNSALGGGPVAVPVARVQAETAGEACDLAGKKVTVYSNQYLYAEDAEEYDRRQAEEDSRVEVLGD
ncbi:MAG TPA: hypothetical protein VFI13_09390 [Gemmatimonadales bacterium]|nr:hypothetical protein [Gemmatimonadales bacterium]